MRRAKHTERALGGFDEREDLAIRRVIVGEVEVRKSDGGEVGSDERERSEGMKLWTRRKKKNGEVRCSSRHRHGS